MIEKLNAVKKGVAKASGWRMRDDEVAGAASCDLDAVFRGCDTETGRRV